MNFLLLLLGFTLFAETGNSSEKWGQIGHYVTGEIAEYHLSETARENVNEILGNISMPLATVWMDDIRADNRYDYTSTWHWASIPDGMENEEAEQEETGGHNLGS